MLMVKVNIGFHKLFGIKYIFVSGVSHCICMHLGAPFILFNLCMFLGVLYGVLVVFKYLIQK
jgi:hypothetical protein